MKNLIFLIFLLSSTIAFSQDRWQQKAVYTMQIDFDTESHQFTGTQEIIYTNNSPDTLHKVFYHLYFNAFQPGSMMDQKSMNVPDPDRRIGDRISFLRDTEIGYLEPESLLQDGAETSFEVEGTILEVTLPKPILPGSKTSLVMEFNGQVPVQIRRSGRSSYEGISYSMSQWYPKLSEYDRRGWHANPYIAREFHGVWSDFDVKITINKNFILAGTGVLQNPNEIGYGYESEGVKVKHSGKKLTWHFKAEKVIDFVWAADPDYVHDKAQVPDGPVLHFFYENEPEISDNWKTLQDYAVRAFRYMNETFGEYPYPVYSVIQGGDGGMEYPMATLIVGEISLPSLISTTVHELIHSWFQATLATNESLYHWMDEGFTEFAQNLTLSNILDLEQDNPHYQQYQTYFNVVRSGLEEPMAQHADHFDTNRAYTMASYSKGAIFLSQLGYIIGDDVLMKGMRRYYNTWKFRHPEPIDLIRIMEKESGLELDWYLEYWVNSTKTIDYSISNVSAAEDGGTVIEVGRIGKMPMPVEIMVYMNDESRRMLYLPLRIMRGQKSAPEGVDWTYIQDWPWTHPTIKIHIPEALENIANIEIDPSGRMADVDRTNNQRKM